MASEIRVDKINSLSGVGTVTLSPTGVDIAGITTAATLRATTGIVTSLTAGSLTSLGAVSGTTGTFTSTVKSGTTATGIIFSAGDSGNSGDRVIQFKRAATTNDINIQAINSGSGGTNLLFNQEGGAASFGGALSATSGTFTGNVAVSGANITLQDSGGASDDRLTFGAGTDLSIYHDGSNSYISNGTNNLIIKDTTGDDTKGVYIQSSLISFQDETTNEQIAKFTGDGAVELYYDNSKKFETHPQGAAISSAGMTMPAMNSFSSQILVGASGFIGNYHDGTTNQQLIIGTNQYFDSAYKSRTNTTAAHIQFFDRSFRFNTAAAPGSAGGTLTQVQALRIDTDGVKFGTDTATANALDDYEEGTFSATASAAGYSNVACVDEYYTKIGNIVHIAFRLNVSSSASDGDLTISGLPFTNNGSAGYCGVQWQDGASFTIGGGRISGTQVQRFGFIATPNHSGNANFYFQGTYRT